MQGGFFNGFAENVANLKKCSKIKEMEGIRYGNYSR